MSENLTGKRKDFSTFLTKTLLCFVAVSIALVVGSLYGLLSHTMTREFFNRIEAKRTNVGLLLEDRLGRAERELERLGMDNAIGVSLAPGVRSKLDKLPRMADLEKNGVFFMIWEKDTDTIIPPIPESLEKTRARIQRLKNAPANEHHHISAFESGRYFSIFVTPMNRNGERVGTAFAVYDPSKDESFWKHMGAGSEFSLLMSRNDQLVNLRNGRRLFMPKIKSDPIPKAINSSHITSLPETIFLPINGIENLYLGVSTSGFKEHKITIIWKFAGLCILIFICTMLISFFIARKVSQPLQSMADQALEIAKTPTSKLLEENEIRYLEFKQLAQAFNKVVGGLLESHADLAKSAQKKLDASEKRYQTLVETSPAGLFTMDINFNIHFANQALERISGYRFQELTQMKLENLIHPNDWKKMLPIGACYDNSVLKLKRERFEIRWIRKDQHHIWVELLITPVEEDGEHLFQVYVTNISERKTAEEALRESENRLRSIFDNAAVGIVLISPDGHFIEFNDTACKILDYSRNELMNLTGRDITPSDEVVLDLGMVQKAESGSQKYLRLEKRYLKKDGTVIWGDVCATILYDKEGKPEAVLGIILDITESKKVLQERIRLAIAVEQTADSIIITDTDRIIQYVNPAFERMSGFSRQEVIGKKPEMIWSDQHDDNFVRKLLSTLGSGMVWKGRVTNRGKDGFLYETETTISPIRDKNGAIVNFVNIKRDVTHEARLEKQLAQAQKMQAIGTLAGGIAHDFNNILSAVMGYTEMCLIEAPKETQIPRRLDRVMNACQRARELVKQILTFSRQTNQERKHVQIHLVVTEAMKLLRASLPTTMEIRLEILDESAFIIADPTQIHQVLMNLCTNAAHAMREKGGILRVRLESINLDREMVTQYLDLEPGNYIRLTVSDTGNGMDKKTLERIFEPFFTTKTLGEGTGMGLAVVHGIVKSHGGAIRAYSEPDRGASFQVLFPRIMDEKSFGDEMQQPLPTGNERILVVDDEEFVVDMATEMLEHLGYTIVSCMNGVEALELFKRKPHRFDLVITDQTMPQLTGIELSQKLLEIRPDIPIILCTGFSDITSSVKAQSSGIKAFLMKPFITREIATTIRKVLED